jgi:hypothetical protein
MCGGKGGGRERVIFWLYMAVRAHICTIFQHNHIIPDENLGVYLWTALVKGFWQTLWPRKGSFYKKLLRQLFPLAQARPPQMCFLGTRTCMFTITHTSLTSALVMESRHTHKLLSVLPTHQRSEYLGQFDFFFPSSKYEIQNTAHIPEQNQDQFLHFSVVNLKSLVLCYLSESIRSWKSRSSERVNIPKLLFLTNSF